MEKSKFDKESYFLLALIAFGLIVTLFIEILHLKHRPVILLIFIGISTTALIYKLLGGLEDTVFSTPLFRLGGSGAFLFAFIAFINPILERQTYPSKQTFFEPAISTWIPVSNQNLKPIDSLNIKFMDYNFQSTEFGLYDINKQLHFNLSDDEVVNIFNDEEEKIKLGKIKVSELKEKLTTEHSISNTKSEVFMTNFKINELSRKRSWFPYKIKPTHFDNNTTTYEIVNDENSIVENGEITLRGSNIHKIDGETFLITIHRVNHSEEPLWVRFAVTKLEANSE